MCFVAFPFPQMPVSEGVHENGKRKYVPIHDISIVQIENLCALYAFTGYDSTSFFTGHSKITCLKMYKKHLELFNNLGLYPIIEDVKEDCETFVCSIYGVDDCKSVDHARRILFGRAVDPECLPPTSDALSFYMYIIKHQYGYRQI